MKRWTDEEENKLKDLISKGKTQKEVAELLNRTVSSINSKASKLGIKATKLNKVSTKKIDWCNEELKALVVLVTNGMTHEEVAISLGKPLRNIKSKCQELQIKNTLLIDSEEKYNKVLKGTSMIPLEKYKGSKVSILHRCLSCGVEYKCKPNNKLNGHKCKYCNKGINNKYPALLYLVYFSNLNLYKIGITNTDLNTRMRYHNLSYEVILVLPFITGKEAAIQESIWLQNVEQFKLNTGKLSSGNTETFKY